MKKLSRKSFEPLDQEEKDLMESIEREEWRSVKNIKQEKEKAIAAARLISSIVHKYLNGSLAPRS
jgi:hypothetical protein